MVLNRAYTLTICCWVGGDCMAAKVRDLTFVAGSPSYLALTGHGVLDIERRPPDMSALAGEMRYLTPAMPNLAATEQTITITSQIAKTLGPQPP